MYASRVEDFKALEQTGKRLSVALAAMTDLNETINEEIGERIDFSAYLHELSTITPETIRFIMTKFDRSKDGLNCKLTGYATPKSTGRDDTDLDPYVQRVRASPLFYDVVLSHVQMQSVDQLEGQRFQMAMKAVTLPRNEEPEAVEVAAQIAANTPATNERLEQVKISDQTTPIPNQQEQTDQQDEPIDTIEIDTKTLDVKPAPQIDMPQVKAQDLDSISIQELPELDGQAPEVTVITPHPPLPVAATAAIDQEPQDATVREEEERQLVARAATLDRIDQNLVAKRGKIEAMRQTVKQKLAMSISQAEQNPEDEKIAAQVSKLKQIDKQLDAKREEIEEARRQLAKHVAAIKQQQDQWIKEQNGQSLPVGETDKHQTSDASDQSNEPNQKTIDLSSDSVNGGLDQ